jgi:WD40 repeat protein
VATGTVLQTLSGHAGWLDAVAFSPDGARLATASQDHTARVWDLATGETLFTLRGHTDEVVGVAFRSDGAQLGTISLDGTGRLWDAATGQVMRPLTGHVGEGQDIAFSPSCAAAAANAVACVPRVVTADREGTARIWDAATGAELLVLRGHAGPVFGVAFSPNGHRVATAGFDNKVKVWDAATGQELLTLAGHTGPVVSLAFSPDGTRLATGGIDGTARIWNLGASRELLTLGFPEHTAAALSPDGARLLVGFDNGVVQVWEVSSALTHGAPARLVLNLDAHTDAVKAVVFSPDGQRLATASRDHVAKVWNAATGAELLSLAGHTAAVEGLAFSPDGAHLATASGDRTTRVWDLATGAERWQLAVGLEVSAVGFSPDCALSVSTVANPCVPRLAAGSVAGSVSVWNLATGEQRLALPGHADRVNSVHFSADGRHLATASYDGTAIVWDLATGQAQLSLSGHHGGVTAIAFNPSCANPFARPALPENVPAGVRGPCGIGVATAGVDGMIRLWDAESGLVRLTLLGHTDEVLGLGYTTDGKQLFTHSWDGTVRFFVLELEDLLDLARARSTRRLTTNECQQYLHQPRCAWDAEPTTTTSATGMPP